MRRKSYISLTKRLKSPPEDLLSGEKKFSKCIGAKASPESSPPSKEKDEDLKGFRRISKQLHRMSNEELRLVLTTDDDFFLDCILDQTSRVKHLLEERDELQAQAMDLASFNYAREPEFARDRAEIRRLLEDTSSLKRNVNKSLASLLDMLTKQHTSLSEDARKHEEQSESMANEYLDGNKTHDEFLCDYLRLRKDTSQKRIRADKMAKEKNRLADYIDKPTELGSPIPTPRQRKRVSLNKQ